jgi:hypothetical protein
MDRLKRGRKAEGGESNSGGKRGVRPQRISNGRVSHQVIHPLRCLNSYAVLHSRITLMRARILLVTLIRIGILLVTDVDSNPNPSLQIKVQNLEEVLN